MQNTTEPRRWQAARENLQPLAETTQDYDRLMAHLGDARLVLLL